ncbi:MAG: glycoside hydrolase family 99-like domain-containing protein, partial [Thermoguttaceae bacterium]
MAGRTRLQNLLLLAGMLLLSGTCTASAAGQPAGTPGPATTTDHGPKPFVRDIAVGYLLNYNFLSPRPYCWTKDPLLSGWEVDKSGGTWACHPGGLMPRDFFFHSDWFKLVDTSTTAAVTIKHQIARQTQGRITLEYRFRLPARMDGACWQLRDMEQAGVSIVTAGGGNLCYEMPGGEPRVLQPYEADHDYGVKVVADLDAKTADVYVDGALMASAAPFCRPIRSIDYVLIKTGDAATGEMFLGPVNVYKGYAVHETFVTSGVGKLPADWTLEQGAAGVQKFECCSKPDIFSLKLSGTRDEHAILRKNFAAIQTRTVLEYRFLLPEKCDETCVVLGDRKPGPLVATFGGNLCYAGAGGNQVILAYNYRANLWYTVKVVADPKSGTADVYVNGKPLIRGEPFPTGPDSFSQVYFQTPSVMWVDDVSVYPWQDYPADYVPEPKPCPAKDGYLLGVQSCNLWREGNAYAGWEYVYPFRAERKPYLGWYEEGNPEETDWEIKWQVEHGIGFEMHCWYRPNNAMGRPIKEGVLDQQIIKGLFNARYSRLKKFAIMVVDEGACETNLEDLRQNLIPYWIEYFFKDPRYLKIDGKPVLSIYSLGNLLRMMGGEEGAKAAVRLIRDEVAKAGFPGIIILMECRDTGPKVFETMKRIGIDASYAYTWTTADVAKQRARMTAQRKAAAAAGFHMLPSISMGWDRAAWGVHDGGWVPPADYKALALWTRDEFMPSLPQDSLGRRVVMLANWN